jgi:hypothetical protein
MLDPEDEDSMLLQKVENYTEQHGIMFQKT